MKKSVIDKHSRTINDVAQYVYEHFEQPLSLTELAEKFAVSKYHLNRLFFAHTGMNLGEFIQRRRLEYAYTALSNQNASVLDIALQVGYESHAAFSRAFLRLFEIEPNQVKHKQAPQFALAKLIKQPKRFTISGEVLDLPAKSIWGLYGQGFENQSYYSVAQQLYPQIANALALADGFDFDHHQLIGISIDNPWRIKHAQSRFFAGISTSTTLMLSRAKEDKLIEYIMPAGLWARFEHRGPYHTMWQTILNIYASWFNTHDYQLRDSSLIQHYVNDVTSTPAQALVTHIYVPLLKN